MNFFNKYPYLDEHELNLDWLIAKMRSLQIEFDEFKVVNQISFSGAWDITKQYPAWTIVSDNNIGYVSIQPVPAGVLLTNGNYWREVIDYSAQIAGLQSRVVALENTVGDASSGLVKDMNDAQSDIIDLQKHVYKKYIFVSDSYGASVVPELVSRLGLSASDYVNIQYGGSCFGATYGTNLNWQTMIENTVTTDDDTYTDVVYIGGANELSYTPANIIANAAQCYDYVAGRFTNAKQWYMFAGYCAGLNGTAHPLVDRLRLITRLPQCIVDTKRGFAIHEVWYPLANTDNINNSDWMHPTTSGSEKIASLIASCLNGGSSDYQSDYEAITLTSGSHTIVTQQIYMQRHNSKVNVVIRALNMTFGSGITLGSQGIDITLGVLDSKLLRGGVMVPGGAEYRLFLGTTHATADNGFNWVVELFLTNANELVARFLPTYPITSPWPTTLSGLQIIYFNCIIDNYLN